MSEVELCEHVAGEEMLRFGYVPDAATASRAALAGWYAMLVPKLGLAALLNVHTLGNPFAAARRRLGR